jgi:four helix bundle protein
MRQRTYDLRDRLLEFAVSIGQIVKGLPGDRIGSHVAGQLLRSGTAPAAHYAEACGAEFRRDFIHKLKVALKELREANSGYSSRSVWEWSGRRTSRSQRGSAMNLRRSS